MEQNDLNIFETKLDETAQAHLLETARWTKFLGICYTILMVLCLVYFIFIAMYIGQFAGANNDIAGMTTMAMTIGSLFSVGLCIYPIYALLKFSSVMKKGIQMNNQELINDGFRYQKTMYRYLGILTIISLFLILISFILGGIGMMAAA